MRKVQCGNSTKLISKMRKELEEHSKRNEIKEGSLKPSAAQPTKVGGAIGRSRKVKLRRNS